LNSGGGKIKLYQLVLALRWPIIGIVGISILILELIEHPGALTRWDTTFLGEVLLLESLLIITGLAIGWLLSSIREKNTTVNILNSKNELNQRLSSAQDWDQLTELVVEYPRSILPLAGSSLLVYSPKSDQFEVTSYWVSDSHDIVPAVHFQGIATCQECMLNKSAELRMIEKDCLQAYTQISDYDCYCLPLKYKNSHGALLHLCLPAEETPTAVQIQLINSLGPEMAVAIKIAEENHTRQKMLAEKMAENVRQRITRDMHDMLAQNLAYLQLKLDQLGNNRSLLEAPDLEEQLLKLRDVSNETYELVRGTLGALHPKNASRLGDVLSQLDDTFTELNDFGIEFNQTGNPRRLDPLTMHNLYQLYREALSNIAKHAQANHVTTNLDWYEDKFTLQIMDDGIGFDLREVQQPNHYGLEIMKERIKQLDGELSIESIPGSGTCLDATIYFDKLSSIQKSDLK
jgi:signal transduction histidine kinase